MLTTAYVSSFCNEPAKLSLSVDGTDFLFLLDSGATLSSVGGGYKGPLSFESIDSVGIEGSSVSTWLTPPLSIFPSDQPELRITHCLVYMPLCPFNLMGRD